MARTRPITRSQDSNSCTWITELLSGSQVDDDNNGPILNDPTGDLSEFLSQLDENSLDIILPAVPPPLTNSTDLLAELISRLEDDPPTATATATCTVAATSTEIQERNSKWISSLTRVMSRDCRDSIGGLPSTAASTSNDDEPNFQNEDELDKFLDDAWAKDCGKLSSPYVKKLTGLKSYYQRKVEDILKRQKDDVGDQVQSAVNYDLKSALVDVIINSNYDELFLKLKQKVAKTLLGLKARYEPTSKTKRRQLNPKATKILNEWFEEHIKNPYPTNSEKDIIAKHCKITVGQVSNWFNNKRSRVKKEKSKKGKGKQL